MRKPAFLIIIIVFATGCTSAVNRHQVLQHELNMPINCEHAKEQITALEKNHAPGSERFLNGIASILPTSALLNIIAGEYTSRWKLANGEFNKKLFMRIEEIEKACDQKELMVAST